MSLGIRTSIRRLYRQLRPLDMTSYWNQRTRRLGLRSAIQVAHTDAEYDDFAREEWGIMAPHLRSLLPERVETVVDYGCGTGRFCQPLHELTGAPVLGLEIAAENIKIAPRSGGVEYRLLRGDKLPLADYSVDVFFIFGVLGHMLTQDQLVDFRWEVGRVVRPGGAVFIVENTSQHIAPVEHYVFRPIEDYLKAFALADLEHLQDFDDLGQTMSIMGGRMREWWSTPDGVSFCPGCHKLQPVGGVTDEFYGHAASCPRVPV